MIIPGGGASATLGSTLGLGMPGGDMSSMSDSVFGGERMERVFLRYGNLPIGQDELRAAGWKKHNNWCNPTLGFAWTLDKNGTTDSEPLVLYTTLTGKPAGVGTIFRMASFPEAQQKWTTAEPLVKYSGNDTVFQVDVAFRSRGVCSLFRLHSGIGDSLTVNPAGPHSQSIPLSFEAPWVEGSCFDGMGTHAFLNTGEDLSMPWNADDLFPVVAMYHEGKFHAIFFASTKNQLPADPTSTWWEPGALSNARMCVNWCGECDFKNHDEDWSTMHIYFNDHNEVKCDERLTCSITSPENYGCCPSVEAAGLAIPIVGDHSNLAVFVVGTLLGACIAGSFALRLRRSPGTSQVEVTELNAS